MEQGHEGAVRIGDDEWLPFIPEGDADPSADFDIDPFLAKTRELWALLETECVAGCCGIAAFDFRPKRLMHVGEKIDLAATVRELKALKEAIVVAPGTVVTSDILNFHAVKETYLKLIDHIIYYLEE